MVQQGCRGKQRQAPPGQLAERSSRRSLPTLDGSAQCHAAGVYGGRRGEAVVSKGSERHFT